MGRKYPLVCVYEHRCGSGTPCAVVPHHAVSDLLPKRTLPPPPSTLHTISFVALVHSNTTIYSSPPTPCLHSEGCKLHLPSLLSTRSHTLPNLLPRTAQNAIGSYGSPRRPPITYSLPISCTLPSPPPLRCRDRQNPVISPSTCHRLILTVYSLENILLTTHSPAGNDNSI